ncbi:MAG: sugar transferase, partial [Burkholderiales bacterium]
MSAWLSQDHIADDAILPCSTGTERALRLFDLLLAAAALVLLALPLAVLRRRAVSQPVRGRHGVVFDRVRLQLPARLPGRVLALLGAANWPVALHVARGEMAWVGPRPRGLDESAAPMSTRVRPGIVNPWFIRQRTAVHFGTEAQADLHYLAQRSITHDIGLLLRGMLVALLPLPAAVIPQRDVADDQMLDWRQFLGDAYRIVERLGLDRIYFTPLFFICLGLLAVNLVMGNVRRFRTIYKAEKTLLKLRHVGSIIFHLSLL